MHIAKTVQSVAAVSNPVTAAIVNRAQPIDIGFVHRVISLTQFTWHDRRPRLALDSKDGKRGHDLDLLSVMVELARRKARIKLPGYENMLPWQVTAGEQHVGTDRYGQIMRLVSHKEHLSFSVRIRDESLYQHETGQFGAPRNYSMVGYNGVWNPGWRGVSWRFSEDEAEFFAKQHLLHDGELSFKYYVHPHRRQSFGSAAYLNAKLLCMRFEDESAFWASELKRLAELGIKMPNDLVKEVPAVLEKGPTKNVFVRRFVMKLNGPKLRGEYQSVSNDEAGYRQAYLRHQEIIEDLLPLIQFVVRADEAAFYLYGMESVFTPWWIKGPKWHKGTRLTLQSTGATLNITPGLSLSYFTDEVPKMVAA